MLITLLIVVALLFGFMVGGLRGAVWVPARIRDTEKLLASLDIAKDAHIYEFGCGDGRNLRLINRRYRNASLAAIEINPVMWLIAFLRNHRYATIRLGDGWKQNLSDQDVVLTFLTTPFMARFEQKMLAELKPGSLVISYAFNLPTLPPLLHQNSYFVYRIP